MRVLKLLTVSLALMAFVAMSANAGTTGVAAGATLDTTKKAGAGTTKKAASLAIKGSVVSVDAIANTIVVKVTKGKVEKEDTLSIESGAKILSGKKEITLGDITAGNEVSVVYKMSEGKKVATKITKIEKATK